MAEIVYQMSIVSHLMVLRIAIRSDSKLYCDSEHHKTTEIHGGRRGDTGFGSNHLDYLPPLDKSTPRFKETRVHVYKWCQVHTCKCTE